MSVHNVLRRAGTLIAGVRRMVGGQEDTSLERLGETLTPILNPWGLPEWAKLRGEDLYAVRTVQAAVVAEFSGIALTNPAGSGALIVVDNVQADGSAIVNGLLEIMAITAISGTYLTATTPASIRDRRFRNVFSCKAQFLQGSDAGNTFGAQLEQQTFKALATAGQTTRFTNLPVILRPGDCLAVIGQTVNVGLTASWAWRERSALPGELA